MRCSVCAYANHNRECERAERFSHSRSPKLNSTIPTTFEAHSFHRELDWDQIGLGAPDRDEYRQVAPLDFDLDQR